MGEGPLRVECGDGPVGDDGCGGEGLEKYELGIFVSRDLG